MKPWVRVSACVVACVAAVGSGFSQSLPFGSETCLARLEEQRAAERRENPVLLGDVCPELVDALNDGVWGEALAGIWAEELSVSALAALIDVAADYERSPAAIDLPTETLDAVLAEVAARVPPPELSLWDRAMRWLQERLGQRDGAGSSWLVEWLEDLSVPDRWITAFVIGLGVVLVIATVLIVVNELREAGVLARRATRFRAATGGAAVLDTARPWTLDEVKRAPLARQPALLLVLVLERLRRRSAIADSATHRELLAAAGSLDDRQRDAFAAVVGAAERVTFGDWMPTSSDLAPLLTSGESLLQDLATTDGVSR